MMDQDVPADLSDPYMDYNNPETYGMKNLPQQ